MSALLEPFGGDWQTAILILSAVVSVCLFLFVIASATNRARSHRKKRLDRASRATVQRATPNSVANLRRADNSSSVDKAFSRLLPRPQNLRRRLEQTGLPIGIGHYALVTILLILVETIASVRVIGFPLPLAILLGIASGVAIPHMFVGALIKRRQARFTQDFPEGIDVIVRGLRAGLPVSESIIAVGRELTGPVSETFADVSERLSVGDPVDKAVMEAGALIDTPEIKFFAISLSIQRETGGNLAETLANLSDILRRRRQMKLKIKALSSEARASAYILGCLPFVMFLLLYFVNYDYIIKLFVDPRGMVMVGVGLAMMACGGFVMYRMVKFEI